MDQPNFALLCTCSEIQERGSGLLTEMYRLVKMAKEGAASLEDGSMLAGEEDDGEESGLEEFLKEYEIKERCVTYPSLF